MWLVLLFVTTAAAAEIMDYKTLLVDPAWEDVFAAGGMHVGTGRAKRFVEVTDTQANIPHQACLLPSGKPGHCRHLRHCIQDEYRHDFIKFMDYLCIINRSSVGACCPDNAISGQPESLAGDLPATASRHEDEAQTRITRAENRGCGLSTRATSGGEWGVRLANPREWPWMASVMLEGEDHHCGGVLITDRHVLTAAHCTRRYGVEDLHVRLGEYDTRYNNDSRTYDFTVVEKIQHAEFDSSNYHNDLAILKLHRPTVFNTYVWPICLPPDDLNLVNETVIVTGWGAMWYGGPYSPVLLEVSMPVWDHDHCADSFVESIFNETICAGGVEGGKDACQGDSGGPLMYQMSSGRWASVGIVSWGLRCGEPAHPGIYTRVDKYLQWILENSRF